MPESLIINYRRFVVYCKQTFISLRSCREVLAVATRLWRSPGTPWEFSSWNKAGLWVSILMLFICFIFLCCRVLPAPNTHVSEAQAFHFSCTCSIPLLVFLLAPRMPIIFEKEKRMMVGDILLFWQRLAYIQFTCV